MMMMMMMMKVMMKTMEQASFPRSEGYIILYHDIRKQESHCIFDGHDYTEHLTFQSYTSCIMH